MSERPRKRARALSDSTSAVSSSILSRSHSFTSASSDGLGSVSEHLRRRPPIWCASRQELCESLPYFRSYQSGLYTNGGRAYGYLLDGHGHSNDVWAEGGRVIVSHAGGGAEASSGTAAAKKTYSLSRSQSRQGFRCKALLNNMQQKIPLVLLSGSNYLPMAFLKDLDVRYAVLGHYYITDAWSEPDNAAPDAPFRLKFRFEFAESKDPWWSSYVDMDEASPLSPASLPLRYRCVDCGSLSPRVFVVPLCLNEDCVLFAKQRTSSCSAIGRPLWVANAEWDYSSCFLQCRFARQDLTLAFDGLLPAFEVSAMRRQGRPLSFDRDSWRGFHCRECGRLNSRRDWTHLACDCGNSFYSTAQCVDAKVLACALPPAPPLLESSIQRQGLLLPSFDCERYELPDCQRDSVLLLRPKAAALLRQCDQLFHSFQQGAVPFQRCALKRHKMGSGSTLLSQSFLCNYGEPYNFSLACPSITLNDAPLVVHATLAYLESALRSVIAAERERLFNELLCIAYLEDCKLSFHDDGEKGVGPTIASVSLGSAATMHFRRKVLKRCRDSVKARECLRLEISHGDIVVMSGASIQRLYEHAGALLHPLPILGSLSAVVPSGFRIAATARNISNA